MWKKKVGLMLMKKSVIIVFSFICMLMFSCGVNAESVAITCAQTIEDGIIHIRGQIPDAETSNEVILLVCDDLDNMTYDNIWYLYQTTSTASGEFEFVFTLPDVEPGSVYEYRISSDSDAPICVGVLDLSASDEGNSSNRTITCTEDVNENQILIRGSISNSTGKPQITLLMCDDLENFTFDEIRYVSQATADNDGNFEFLFTVSEEMYGKIYEYRVGSDSCKSVYIGTITIGPNPNKVQYQFVNADVDVNIVNYIPSISGTIECGEGKTVEISIVNTTDNVVVSNEILTQGVHNVSYQLPSLLSGKHHSLIVTGNDGDRDLAVLTIDINPLLLSVEIGGHINISDNVTMDAAVQSNNTGLINKNITISESREISVTIPNILSNGSFHLTATGYEMVDVKPANKTISYEYVASGNCGEQFRIIAGGHNIISFNNIFTLEYNPEQISPVSLYGMYYNDSLDIGIKGDIEILSVEPGKIKFRKINKQLLDGHAWTGVLNIFKFKFNENYSGNSTIYIHN